MRSDLTEPPFEAPERVAQAPVAAPVALDPSLAPGAALDSRVVLALQRSAGNCSVSRMLAAGGAMAKVQGDEDEFAPEEEPGDDRVNVLTVETGGEAAGAGGQAVTVSVEAGAEPAGREFAHRASPDFAKCGVTAAASISAGAAPTHALDAGMYGLTFPESVDVTITACKEGSKWVPGVLTLVGRYSMQTRLLPGQSEVTGPGGNTTKTNFCKQVSGLKALGNQVGNPWYMISAVVAHEQVHESRFLPALNAVSAKIVAAIEAVSIPDDGKMAEADALKALQANAAFKAAVKTAYTTWLTEAARRVAGDHTGGGPTDRAEKAIVDPMIASICAEGKKSSWGACPACPP